MKAIRRKAGGDWRRILTIINPAIHVGWRGLKPPAVLKSSREEMIGDISERKKCD
jgi:hypothetical protein